MKITLKSLLATLLVLLISLGASARGEEPSPIVGLTLRYPVFSTESLTETEIASVINPADVPIQNLYPYFYGHFPRLLGVSGAYIRNFIMSDGALQSDSPNAVIQTDSYNYQDNLSHFNFHEVIKGGTTYLIVEYLPFPMEKPKSELYIPIAVYILENNRSVGYGLMDQLRINHLNNFPEFDLITQQKKDHVACSFGNFEISMRRAYRSK